MVGEIGSGEGILGEIGSRLGVLSKTLEVNEVV
jgi:hypothetical protein